MAQNKPVVCSVALIGRPVLEVSVLVSCHGTMINAFHELINPSNTIMESYREELMPMSDPIGTYHEHGLSEEELFLHGLPYETVKERLFQFLEPYVKNSIIIVNNSLYRDMELPEPYRVLQHISCNEGISDAERLKLLHGRVCQFHRSSYFQTKSIRECAMLLSAIMLEKFLQQ